MSAVNDVEHTIWQTSLLGQTGEDLSRSKHNQSDMDTVCHHKHGHHTMEAPGSFSEGLSTYVLPVTTPTGNIHNGIMAGKLKGQIPAHTPRGCLYEYESSDEARFSAVSPIIKVAAPHVCSTTSRPRKTSPRASARVLPCTQIRSDVSAEDPSRPRMLASCERTR